MTVAALILAAGSSARMGRPKALLNYRGATFIENIIKTANAAAIEHIVVAVSPYDDKIRQALGLYNVIVVTNAEAATAGPIGSVRAGVNELVNRMVEYIMVWPVDQPHIQPITIRDLRSVAETKSPLILVPVYQGRRGHPVLFSRALFAELLAAPDNQGAGYVVRRIPERVAEMEVIDPAVVEDIDTPEDYERVISSTKSLL